MGLRGVAVDAGSVRSVTKSKFGKFGWAAWDMPGGPFDQVVGHSGTEVVGGRSATQPAMTSRGASPNSIIPTLVLAVGSGMPLRLG